MLYSLKNICFLLFLSVTGSFSSSATPTCLPSSISAQCPVQKDITLLKEHSEKLMSQTLQDVYRREFGKAAPVFSGLGGSASQTPLLYVFVSLSMPLPGLIDLGKQARVYGGVLVLRGLLQGSYKKTALYLKEFVEKAGTGVIIDPLLFRQHNIQAVPFVVLTSSSRKASDRIGGFIPVRTALEKMQKEGALKEEAGKILTGVSALQGKEKSS